MRTLIVTLAVLVTLSAGGATFSKNGPTTTNNDDGCDIGVMPAATLLLPYFEVDCFSPASTAATTLFTVYNVTNRPQIARVTLWTDLAFPILDFNVFLTGYDVQSINLYDVIARGVIGTAGGTSSQTEPGLRSQANDANPGFLPSAGMTCSLLPGTIPAPLLADVRTALTAGAYLQCGTSRVGLTHSNAIGYATIDVVGTCSTTLPTDPAYFTTELLYDNVLGGDYMQVNPNPTTGNYAGGNPLVHIRAVPEGGAAGSARATSLPYTFYDRLTPRAGDRTRDRRQPLPSAFSARYIQGGTGAFNTNFKIWREAATGPDAVCSAYTSNNGTRMRVIDEVRFDEHENPVTFAGLIYICCSGPPQIIMPATSSSSTSSGIFPPISALAGDVAGWVYLNLNNSGSPEYSVTPSQRDFRTGTSTTLGVRQSQNWAVVSMFAEGRYSTDFDALTMANGCSTSPQVTPNTYTSPNPIGPGANANP